MIPLPDFTKAFDYENNFWLSADKSRLSKLLAHYELFKATQELPGHIVECGVFKGISLARFAMMRALFGNEYSRKIVGFDIFGRFPEAGYKADKKYRDRFVAGAGDQSISVEQMKTVLAHKKLEANVELVAGDIVKTVPAYVKANPELRISLLNLDTDIYEPAKTILEHFWPRIVPGGILILDDYNAFPGETRAVDEYFKGKIRIRKFPFTHIPCYVVKE